MLLGREAECRAIDELLGGALAGRGGSLVVLGEPGIGKSALLGYARERAGGLRVLHARGVEQEAPIAFAGLSALLAPVVDRLGSLPDPQRVALAAALGLAAPEPVDPYTAFAATLWLLAAAAEEHPLVAIVDDAHWLDRASAHALLFAARRLENEAAAVLFAARPSEGVTLSWDPLPRLDLAPLDRTAAGELVTRHAAAPPAPAIVDRLHEATTGNPLALIEVSAGLSERQLSGVAPLEDPIAVGPSVERAFERQLEALSDDARRSLAVAAAEGTGDLAVIAPALEALGLDGQLLEAAERAGLVAIEAGRLEFRHPILRAVAYHGVDAGERRAAHRALADVLAEGGPADRRAWHLAAAITAPDEEVARELEHAADNAAGRNAYAAAAQAYARAATLSPQPGDHVRRLAKAGSLAMAAGDLEEAQALLEDAASRADDGLPNGDLELLLGVAQVAAGGPQVGYDRFVAAAHRLEPSDPGRAAALFTQAAMPAFMRGRVELALESAQRAVSLAGSENGRTAAEARLYMGGAMTMLGRRGESRPLVLDAVKSLEAAREPLPAMLVFGGLQFLTWVDEWSLVMKLSDEAIEQARAASAPGALSVALMGGLEARYKTGDWARLRADAVEALHLAEEFGHEGFLPYVLARLAELDASQGKESESRAHAARALGVAERLGIDSVPVYVGKALGRLELGLGRYQAAADQLVETDARARGHGVADPSVTQYQGDLVEALLRSGDRERAGEAAERLDRQATDTGGSWSLAVAGRCRGLLAEDGFEAHFTEALEHHARVPAPFERALTELCFAERMRRARRRGDARQYFRRALETFDHLGARPWAERARSELRANGDAAPRPSGSPLEQLTPQELRTALVVARGTTNREAAAELFVSPKTVEVHLGRIYRKLGIRSRTELAALVGRMGGQGDDQ